MKKHIIDVQKMQVTFGMALPEELSDPEILSGEILYRFQLHEHWMNTVTFLTFDDATPYEVSLEIVKKYSNAYVVRVRLSNINQVIYSPHEHAILLECIKGEIVTIFQIYASGRVIINPSYK